MKRIALRSISTLLMVVLVCTFILPPALVSAITDEELIEQYDIPNTWARPALLFAVKNGILEGKDTGLCPEDPISRAEVAAILVRLTKAETNGDLSAFSDVDAGAWYFDSLAKAYAAGLMNGCGDNTMRPSAQITREEAFAAVSGLIGLTGGDEEDLRNFFDWESVSAWARDALMPMIRAGYVHGADCLLTPKRNITRQEFAQLIHSIFTGIGTEISMKYKGNYCLAADKVPEGTTVTGDLILCSDAPEITLKNITVTGRLVIRGCGPVSLSAENCTAACLTLCRPFAVSGSENDIHRITVLQDSDISIDCTILEVRANTAFSGKAFSAAAVKGTLTNTGEIRYIYSAEDYRGAQKVRRARVLGKTNKDTVLYQRYKENEHTFLNPIKTLPKGMVVMSRNRYQVSAQVTLMDGTEGYLEYEDFSLTDGKYYIDGDYPAAVKECYVNYIRGYESKTDYLIWINRWTLKLACFSGGAGRWKMLFSDPCVIGKNKTLTNEGIYSVYKKQDIDEESNYFYHHLTWFDSKYAIHTRLYNYDGSFYDASMGLPVSQGCVRMYDGYAIWIHDTIPIGTTVVVW